jgi:opacity protein-like surface antigen
MIRASKTCSLILLACLYVAGAAAQSVEIAPIVGYRIGGGFDAEFDDNAGNPQRGTFDLKNSVSYGLTVDILLDKVWREMFLELIWDRQKTDLVEKRSNSPDAVVTELTSDYFLAGISSVPYPAAFNWFGTLYLGAARFAGGGQSETRFAWGLGIGVKYRFSERLGARVQGRTYLSTVGESRGGTSCSLYLCTEWHGFMSQFDVSGGLFVAL